MQTPENPEERSDKRTEQPARGGEWFDPVGSRTPLDKGPRPGEASNTPSYWLTRFIILRLLGLVYFIAFLAAANQLVPLVGEHGLLPAKTFLTRVAANLGSR